MHLIVSGDLKVVMHETVTRKIQNYYEFTLYLIKSRHSLSFYVQKDRDLELAARIGQALLKRNHLLTEQNEALEEQLGQTLDQVSDFFFSSFFLLFMMIQVGLVEIYYSIVNTRLLLSNYVVYLEIILLIGIVHSPFLS